MRHVDESLSDKVTSESEFLGHDATSTSFGMLHLHRSHV